MTDQLSDHEQLLTPRTRWLDRPLASLGVWNWEKLAWAVLLIAALAIRLIALDNRTASHDEAQHAWFAYNLFTGKGYEHNPVYHGPFIYHAMALSYLLFGVNDVAARIPTALFGFGIVWLMWLTRGWLGKRGAFFAGVLTAFSPALLHYSRHTRHDIYEIFWAVLLVIAVFRYIELGRARGERWVYIAAAALSLALASKEDAFIHGAALGGFLVLVVLLRGVMAWNERRRVLFASDEDGPPATVLEAGLAEWPGRIVRGDWLALLGGVAVSLLGMLIYRLMWGSAATPPLFAALPVIVLPPLVAAAWAWLAGNRRAADAPRSTFSPAVDMVILLATLILPWTSPFLIKALGYDPLNYTTGILATASVLAATIGIAAVFGLLWDARRWLAAAGIFTAIFVVFFTGLFTNGQGLATGVIGSLGYWLSQQEVARGSQPWYYYLLVVPLYEFLPLLLALPLVLAALFRRNRVSLALSVVTVALLAGWIGMAVMGDAAIRATAPFKLVAMAAAAALLVALVWGGFSRNHAANRLFLGFLPFFVLFSWFAYAVAGEKMPWLITSITLPMCIAGGWVLGKLVDGVQWRRWGWRNLVPALLVWLLLAAVLGMTNSQPFRGRDLMQLSQTGQWLAALLMGLAAVGLLVYLGLQNGFRQGGRLIALALLAVLGFWSLRTAVQANFVNQNYVSEYLFYAHGSPDPKADMRQIEEISRRTVGDQQLKIAYDDDSSWPFNWYFSTWPNAVYFGATPSRESLADAVVVLVGSKNLERTRPFLQRDYYEFDRRLIWWPNEDYKTTSLPKIWDGLRDKAKRGKFWDVVLWRRYDQPMNQWPLVHRYSLFVRKDIANELWDFGVQPANIAPMVDPYEQGVRKNYFSEQIIGSGPGAEPGQLNFPRNMAVAPNGDVYVADSGNYRIEVFTATGELLRAWGSSCELYAEATPGCVDPDGAGPLQLGDGQMREPWGIAIGPNGNVYIADTWNHRIEVFSPQGEFVTKWGSFATTNGEAVGSPAGFWGPRAVVVDAAGNVYVADTGNKRIQIFDAQGEFLGQYGGGGVAEGYFDEPVGLALVANAGDTPGGILYVADTWNLRIQKLAVTFTDGEPLVSFVKEWSVDAWSTQSVVNKPFIAVDSTGQVYITDPEAHRVLAFDGEGQFKAVFGLYGNDAQSFALPNGIAIGPDDKVFVADADNHRILVFPPVR